MSSIWVVFERSASNSDANFDATGFDSVGRGCDAVNFLGLVALALLGLLPARAMAHNLGVDWKQRGTTVEIEAFFSDGTQADRAKVRIIDAAKKTLAEGLTDQDGKVTVHAPAPGKYQLIVDAGAGHRKEAPITIAGSNPAGGLGEPSEQASPGDRVTRAEFTGFPWGRAAVGVGVIAFLGGVFWLSRRKPPP